MKQREDIREELKNIAPRLSELTPTNPFDAPHNYFETLPNDVLNKIKRQSDLVESLREVESNVATNPFAVSDTYFESLPDVVMGRVKSEPKIIELSPSRYKNWLSIAAAVAAVVLMAIPLMKPGNVHTNQPVVATTEALKEVSNDDLYSYISEDVGVLHADEVAAGLSDSKIDTMEYQFLTAQASAYDDAMLDITQLDIESLDIESL